MFDTARVRLTLWYLLILAVIVAVLSLALYRVLLHVQYLELQTISPPARQGIVHLFARDEPTLALQIGAIDLGVLILAALGAYILAGRTLAPIRASMERQQRFAAAASHELRTPLTVLRGTMEVALLKRRTLEEYERILQDAVAEAGRMSELIGELLALARAEADREALHLAPLDLRQLVEEIAARLRPLAEQKGQRLEVAPDGPLLVLGDATKLQQALANLVENALTYTPAGGTIQVSGRRDRSRVLLQVRDTGPGIGHEHLPRIFEPFYRVDKAHSDSTHAGLGLALSAWIVRAHGGEITVNSHEGVGSVFTVALPLAPRV